MSITINIIVESNHVIAVAEGEYVHFDAKENLRTAIEAARKNKIPNVLIDARELIGNISLLQRFDLGVLISEILLQESDTIISKVAFVGNEPIVDPNRFGETVARNRGVNILVTTNYNEALEFLEI